MMAREQDCNVAGLPLVLPQWDVGAGITAFTTLRAGGVSEGDYAALNLGGHVGDSPAAVAANRQRLTEAFPTVSRWQWLSQVHGTRVVHSRTVDAGDAPEADGLVSDEPGVACVVMTADCLPVFLCARDGQGSACCREVALVHVGWRGLVAGVIDAAIAAMASGPEQLLAGFGPCISQAHFEVGGEVREAVMAAGLSADGSAVQRFFADKPRLDAAAVPKYLADLSGLARLRLEQLGVQVQQQQPPCSYAEPQRFYSHRRASQAEQASGRMASVIFINP